MCTQDYKNGSAKHICDEITVVNETNNKTYNKTFRKLVKHVEYSKKPLLLNPTLLHYLMTHITTFGFSSIHVLKGRRND